MTTSFRQSFRHSLPHRVALRLITAVFTAQSLLVAGPAAAQVVPDKTAPSGMRALVDAAANGVPMLHIAPPSTAGVSRNVYEQFNVPQQGVILNNSKDNVQTQLGGWITGNLQLGLAPAKIILNEVSGASRSELKGTLEVAGQKADIVIANPNGILCDGCGFLNADRATLATGKPVFGADGSLSAFDVRQGTLQVGAGGLNATEQQQLDLYARGLVIEGEVWARKLQAIVGANRVLHGTLEELPQSTPIAGTGDTPRFAVDIKELGGMFAGRIWLIATDKGLGVNSSGRMASLAGNLDLSADGYLTLKDTYAPTRVGIVTAGQLTTTGQTIAGEQVAINAPSGWTNSGTLQTPSLALAVPRIDNSGTIAQTAPGANLTLQLPRGLTNTGSIYTSGDLAIQAPLIASDGTAQGELLAGGRLGIAGASVDMRGQHLAANGNVGVQADTLRLVDGAVTSGGDVSIQATGRLEVSGTSVGTAGTAQLKGTDVALDRARIGAQGDVRIVAANSLSANATDMVSNANVALQGASVDAQAATLSAAAGVTVTSAGALKLDASQLAAGQQIALQGSGLSTAAATIAAPRLTLDAQAGALNNAGGKVLASSAAADALVVSAIGINNQGGQLRANGGLVLDAGGSLIDNTGGVIAGTSGSLNNLGSLVNAQGALYTQSDLTLAGFALNNAGGTIATADNLAVTTPGRDIDNTAGVLQAGGAIALDASGAQLKNDSGTVAAQGAVTVTAGTVAANKGTIASGQDLNLTAGNLQAAGASLGSAGAMNLVASGAANLAHATLSAGGALSLQASDVQAAGAKAASGGDLALAANNIHGGAWAAQGDVSAQAQGVLDVTGGGLIAGGNVFATAGKGIVTNGAQVSGQLVTLDAGTGSLSNRGGTIVATATGAALNITSSGIDNTRGVIASAGDASLDARGLMVNNTNGRILADGALNLDAGLLLNRGGTLASGSAIALRGFALDNQGGTIQTAGTLTIDTAGQGLNNSGGKLIAQGDVNVTAGAMTNVGGTVYAGGGASVQAASLDTTSGRITGTRQMDVFVSQSLTAKNAAFASEGHVAATATDIDAQGATVQAGTSVNIAATGSLDASGATIAALGAQAGDVQLAGASVKAQGAHIAGDAAVTVQSAGTLQAANANISAFKSLTLQAPQAVTLDGVQLRTNDQLTVTASAVSANAAVLSAGGKAQLTATSGAVGLANASLIAGDTVTVSATDGMTATSAAIGAVGHVTLAAGAGDFDASGVRVQSQNGGIALQGANVNVAGSASAVAPQTGLMDPIGLVAAQQVSIAATGAVDTSRAVIAGTAIDIAAQGALANRGGQIIADTRATLAAASLDNDGGVIDANGAIAIAASQGIVSNNAGRITTRDVLAMTGPAGAAVTALANRGGTINTTGALALNLRDFDNAGGNVTALAGLAIAAAGDVTNTAGTLASQGDVSINAGGALQSANAIVVGRQGSVSVNAGRATLAGASVLAQSDVAITATQLDANGATFSANTGSLRIDAATGSANLDDARLAAAGAIGVAAGATSANRAAIASGASVALATESLQANAAAIDAQGSVTATARTGAVDASAARITAGADASLTAAMGVAIDQGGVRAQTIAIDAGSGALNNASGTIAAVQSVDIRATGLNNQLGVIAANGDVTIHASSGAVANDFGAITAGRNVGVSGGDLSNTQGSITAQTGSVTASGTSYSGSGASVIAGSTLTLDTNGGALAAGGAYFASQGAMTLSASNGGANGAVQLSDATLIAGASGAALSIASGELQADRINAQAAGNLTVAAKGNLNSNSSTWLAGQSASLAATGAVTLQDATLFGNGSASVRGKSVDASRANIQSPGDVSVVATGGALTITGATLTAGRDLTATGTGAGGTAGAQLAAGRDLTLGNGAYFDFASTDFSWQFGRDLTVHAQGISTTGQTISARNLALDAGSGLLNNAGGTLQATGNVSATARGLDNAGGSIIANGQVTADAGSGTLANASGRIVSISGSSSVGGALVDNSSGLISGAVDVAITGGALNNTGNTIVAGRNLTATMSGAVNNAGGSLIANTGAARVSGNGIDNTNGTISGATVATADAGSGLLANTGGLVTGADVTIGGAVNNAAGVISGSNSVTMTTRALNNDAGVIEAGAGGIRIDTQGNLLTNTNSGTTRGIVSEGAITIASGALNNQAGYIGANGTLAITASGDVNNQQGTLLGLGNVTIDAGSATVDNRAGSITSGADLTLAAGTLNNSGATSTVFAGGNLTVTVSGTVDNSGTRTSTYTAGLLAGGNATITAGAIDNTNGAIVSLGDTTLRTSGTLNNTGGQIGGNTVTIQAAQFINTSGRADAQTMLRMDAPIFSADGTLASNGGMQLSLQGDQTNTGTFSANGSLSLSTTGVITNLGHISAMGELSLTGTDIYNQSGALIDAPTSVTLSASGTVSNEGLINANSGATTINAATLTNTGRIYGDSVTITAGTTNNIADASGTGAVIAARIGDVTVNGDVNNSGESLLLAASGNIAIAGSTRNDGSTISATGDIRFGGALSNTNSNFTTGTQTTSETYSPAKLYITPTFETTRYDASTLAWSSDTGGHWILPSTTYPFATFGSAYKLTSYQCVYQGGDAAAPTCDYIYAPSDPIWTLMGVSNPGPAPTTSDPYGCAIISDAGTFRDTTGACGTYWASYDAWWSQMTTAYANLDTQINTFNTDLQARSLIDWYETSITAATITQTVVATSRPGEVLAGGNITLAGGVNDKGRVVAAGSETGTKLVQVPAEGTKETSQTGTMVFSHRTWSGFPCDCYGRDYGSPQPIADAAVIETLPLSIAPTGTVLPAIGNSTPVGAGSASVPTSIGASVNTARNASGASGITGAVASGPTSATSGGAVSVNTRTTATADAAGTTTISAATPQAGTPADIAVQLAGGVDAPLRGSVIAAQVRAGQAQAITALQMTVAQQAAITPKLPQTVTVKTVAAPQAVMAAGYKTVTFTSGIRAPNNQLFRLNTSPTAHYLVETDPAFTNYRTWASSAWMLTQLGLDPERQLKLYGDGFAEQQLVSDQIVALTGRRFLSGYASTEEEFQALMNAGVIFAKQYQLTPGMALSSEQMAALTTDIVWLEARAVTLPDGSTTQALVPVVYLRRPLDGDIDVSGTLMAASNIDLRSTGDSSDGGTYYAYGDAAAGDGKLTLTGGNTTYTGTLAGNKIDLEATGTLNVLGASVLGIGPDSSALLNARDIVLKTTTQTMSASIDGPNGTSTSTRTSIDRVATVTAASVTLAAANDINLTGAVIKATAGDATLTAGGKITSDTVQESYSLYVPLGGAGGTSYGRTGSYSVASTTNFGTQVTASGNAAVVADGAVNLTGATINAGNTALVQGSSVTINAAVDKLSIDQQGVSGSGYERLAVSNETLSGGVIKAQGDLAVKATNGDVTATGAQITSAGGQAAVSATGDVNLDALMTQSSRTTESASKSDGFLSSSTSIRENSSSASLAQATNVSGATALVQAGRDVNITGSNVVSDMATAINAGRDVNIVAAANTVSTSSFASESKSGFGALGGLSFGNKSTTTTQSRDATEAAASNFASLEGNVTISVGANYQQTGSNVVAPEGDITIDASKVTIDEARQQDTERFAYTMQQSGLSVSLSNPILDAGSTLMHVGEAASKTDDPRMQALAVATAALAIKNVASQVNTNEDGTTDASALASIGFNVSVGTAKTNYTATTQSDTAAGSRVAAGGNVTIRATGSGADSTLAVRGSDISAGANTLLKADGAVTLEAAKSTTESDTQKSMSSASVSVGVNFGKTTGVTLGVAASKANGDSQGESATWTNTHVSAGDTVTIQSGGDTTLRGAVVAAPTVVADVGGKLTIESLQDTSTYTANEKSTGFSVTVPITGTGGGASASASKTNIDSNYQSVTEQSGIRAGDGGFQVSVKGDVNLVGGAITSTDAAVQGGKNGLTYGGVLNTSDIQNSASFSAKSTGATVSTTLLGSSGGIGTKSGNASSVTASAISGVAGDASARTGDAQSGIKRIFDPTKVLDDINAQVRITAAASTQAYTAVATYTSDQRKSLQYQATNATTEQAKLEAQKQMNDLNTEERVLNILIGLVTGDAGVAITREALGAAAAEMRGLMIEDSKKFPGITDGTTTLSNISGPSAGVQGDGVKIGGVRVDLDVLCGSDNARCVVNADGSLQLNPQGQVQFNPTAANNLSLQEFLQSPNAQKMVGPTGGIQGSKGTLFGVPYEAGSWQDRLIESFSGTHDMIGGKLSGLYGDQGNIKRGMSNSERNAYDYGVTTTAILPSIPFAAATLLPPEVWQAVSNILKVIK